MSEQQMDKRRFKTPTNDVKADAARIKSLIPIALGILVLMAAIDGLVRFFAR
ncbi:hypothetical protein AB4Y96_02520 [Phyllobacterium sp. TAF24]|jgi:hypothetical protein|uniref:hypothetical protein n=1 Tax=unclassified Phyllobacterium TaxID=2638441 RepID=UPI00088BB5F7|nr:hypothetical protein [Phyllobacterium sp. OV277]SDO71428.1 hypothetical protein SAMN05443582_102870 [Phyllobacterium sp. OV277]